MQVIRLRLSDSPQSKAKALQYPTTYYTALPMLICGPEKPKRAVRGLGNTCSWVSTLVKCESAKLLERPFVRASIATGKNTFKIHRFRQCLPVSWRAIPKRLLLGTADSHKKMHKIERSRQCLPDFRKATKWRNVLGKAQKRTGSYRNVEKAL